MARDYWVESLPPGRPRFVKVTTTTATPAPGLHRAHTHDGSGSNHSGGRGSTRSARVDFADVTRKEASALRRANDALERENAALKANFRASVDYELRKCVPALEKAVRGLEYENAQLRAAVAAAAGGGVGAGGSREREEAIRKLRHQNTKLRNDNDALRERVGRLEREVAGGGSVRRLVEEVRKWKTQCASMDDEAERLYHKIESVVRRSKRLEMANESAARQARELQRDVEYYKAILRRHGFATR